MFFFSLLLSLQEKFSGARLFYGAASRHRLFLYWPISRCVFGTEGVSPDLPLPGWEATGRHSRAAVGEELADGWEISVQVVVSGKVLEQETGSEGIFVLPLNAMNKTNLGEGIHHFPHMITDG